MKRVLRWLRNGLLGLVALLFLATLVVYVASERVTRRTFAATGSSVAVPHDSASVREGERLAQIRGCTGCHGPRLGGHVLIDDPMLARVVAPNLTIAAREYTDAELERIIRQGIRPSGRSVVVMPSGMFTLLDDADLGRIIAFVRSVTPVVGHPREVRIGPEGRVGLAVGKFTTAALDVRHVAALSPSYPRASDPTARGAYLARTSCTECHGFDLRGDESHPDLSIAAGYSREAFVRFMRTGKALGDRELETMSPIARARFSHFTDGEIDALHDYLLLRAFTAARVPTGPKTN